MCYLGGTEFVYAINITNLTNLSIITSYQLNKIQHLEVFLFANDQFLAVASNYYGLYLLDVRKITEGII